MSNESFDVNYPEAPLINQLTGMACWAASAAMIVGWRDQMSIDPAQIAAATGAWSAYKDGLQPTDFATLAAAWSLTPEPPQSFSIDGLRDLLSSKGPLWVAADVPGFHAIVVTGLYSDGTADNTFVRINDPWDREPGTPGAPGAYLDTHDHGSRYVLSLRQFATEYETASTFPDVSIQILHSAGRTS